MASRRAAYKISGGHIAEGKRGSCSRCPAALAIREQDQPAYASVCTTWAYTWGEDGTRRQARVPADLSTWIYALDRGEHVEPIAFTLHWGPE